MSDVETALVQEFRAIAGVKEGNRFSIRRGDVTIVVDYTGGSSSNLVLSTRYDAVAQPLPTEAGYRDAPAGAIVAIRPMEIVLRREDALDQQSKREGVSREYQTGDEEFDRDIYIDTNTHDDVLRAVLQPAVRSGVKKLCALGVRNVTIDDRGGNVTTALWTFKRPAIAEQMLAAFVEVARGLPAVRASGERHAAKPLGCAIPLMATIGIAAFIGVPILFLGIAGAHDCTESSSDGDGVSLKDGCGSPALLSLFLGAIVGGIAAYVARPFLLRALQGRSDSGSRLRTATLLVFWLVTAGSFLMIATIAYAKMH